MPLDPSLQTLVKQAAVQAQDIPLSNRLSYIIS